MAECARLESVYTARYREFESRPLRFGLEKACIPQGIAGSSDFVSGFAGNTKSRVLDAIIKFKKIGSRRENLALSADNIFYRETASIEAVLRPRWSSESPSN